MYHILLTRLGAPHPPDAPRAHGTGKPTAVGEGVVPKPAQWLRLNRPLLESEPHLEASQPLPGPSPRAAPHSGLFHSQNTPTGNHPSQPHTRRCNSSKKEQSLQTWAQSCLWATQTPLDHRALTTAASSLTLALPGSKTPSHPGQTSLVSLGQGLAQRRN